MRGDRAKHLFQTRGRWVAEPEQVDVARDAVHAPMPAEEQRGALQDEGPPRLADRESVEEALVGVADEDVLEILPVGALPVVPDEVSLQALAQAGPLLVPFLSELVAHLGRYDEEREVPRPPERALEVVHVQRLCDACGHGAEHLVVAAVFDEERRRVAVELP